MCLIHVHSVTFPDAMSDLSAQKIVDNLHSSTKLECANGLQLLPCESKSASFISFHHISTTRYTNKLIKRKKTNKQTQKNEFLIYGIYTIENGFTYVVIMSLDHLIKQQRQLVKLIGTYWRMLLAKMINHGALCTFALKIRFSQLAN